MNRCVSMWYWYYTFPILQLLLKYLQVYICQLSHRGQKRRELCKASSFQVFFSRIVVIFISTRTTYSMYILWCMDRLNECTKCHRKIMIFWGVTWTCKVVRYLTLSCKCFFFLFFLSVKITSRK